MFKKFFLFLLTSLSYLQCSSPIEKAVTNSDYFAFIKLFKDPKFSHDIIKLRSLSETAFKECKQNFENKKFSKRDILRISGGVLLLSSSLSSFKIIWDKYLGYLGFFKRKFWILPGELKRNEESYKKGSRDILNQLVPYGVTFSAVCAIGALYSLAAIRRGFKKEANSEKLRNAAAIKQLLNQN